MPQVNIKIVRHGEKPAIPTGLTKTDIIGSEQFPDLRLEEFIIIERGMQSGSPSIVLHLVDKKGIHYFAETSSRIWETASHVLQGAIMRFQVPEEEEKRILAEHAAKQNQKPNTGQS